MGIGWLHNRGNSVYICLNRKQDQGSCNLYGNFQTYCRLTFVKTMATIGETIFTYVYKETYLKNLLKNHCARKN
jgi:hypothetical protein